MSYELHHGDCLEVMKSLPDCSVDAVVTDPPYGLSFMGKKWDYDVPSVEIWKEVLRVLKPGGHLLSFGGTRTYHRMVVNIEDAGFEIRDQIQWIYGSGFPKSLNVGNGFGTALKPANEPICLARKPLIGTVAENVKTHGTGAINIDATRIMPRDQESDADVYRRLSYLGSASYIRGLDLAQLQGALLRIASELRSYSNAYTYPLRNADDQGDIPLDHELCGILVTRLFPNGVWCGGSSWSVPDSLFDCPSCRHCCDAHIRLLREVALDGIPSLADVLERICSGQYAPEYIHGYQCIAHLSSWGDFQLVCSYAFMFGEHNTLYSIPPVNARFPANVIHDGSEEVVGLFPQTTSGGGDKRGGCEFFLGGDKRTEPTGHKIDSGSASRFFYCAKASKADRNAGLEGFEIKRPDVRTDTGMGTFTEKGVQPQRNHHPTVKPTELMRYLCRLITPPNGTVLDPFAGSGSTGKAAILEGFSFIGIEREQEYAEIARARIAHVSGGLFV